jgi:type I restriction enzyme M protein
MVGQFFTPEIVAECMFRLAGVRAGDRVIDPSCGDGSFLRAAPGGLELHGCEIDPRPAAVAGRLVAQRRLVEGDALTVLSRDWERHDLVIGNPPFSAQANLEKRVEVLLGYDLGAGRKSQCLEVLFLELFWKLAKPNGRIAIILPDGPLGNKPFGYVRDWLLRRAHVEAIISLPRGVFSRTSAKTNLLLARKLPVAAHPYREPTALLECGDLAELKSLRLAEWRKAEPRWQDAILADAQDWRPEAHVEASVTEAAAGAGANADSGVRLGDLFSLRTGYALYGAKRALLDQAGTGRLLLIRAKNVSPEGGLRLDQNRAYIERHGRMFCERSVVGPGEILFVRVGAGCYGRTALMPAGLEGQADDWIHVLTPKREVDAEAVVAWFNREEGRAAVRRLAKGVGALSVSKTALAELKIPADVWRRGLR